MLEEVVFVPVATVIVTAIMVGVGLVLARIEARQANRAASPAGGLHGTTPLLPKAS